MSEMHVETAQRALTEFRREISSMGSNAIDLLAVERRVQELTNACGRALMREVMARADASAPEITIDGEDWGNRRVTHGTYQTVFGEIEMDRATYQRSGRGRVAIPLEQRYGHVGPEPPASTDGTLGRAWHEAAVGTVAFFDAEGNRLKTTYLARMPEPFKATLTAGLEAEMLAVVGERPEINICFASDGAAPQWTALEAMRSRLPVSATGHRIALVDAFHVAEYVQLAANAVEGERTSGAKTLAATWRETIKEETNGVPRVIRAMRSRRAKASTKTARKDLKRAIHYIANQHKLGRMNYPEAIARNFPIGTGVTEAAAKTVVGTRMKRAGARFSQHGGQTVMLFRTAVLSGRFDSLHQELHATYTGSIAA